MKARYAGLIPLVIMLSGLLTIIVNYYPEQNLPKNLVFELPAPFSFAHSLFLSISALIVAYFFARGFLSSGSFNLVALGTGSLVLGLGFLVSQILGNPPFRGPNHLVAISNASFLFAGIFFGVFVTLGLFDKGLKFGKHTVTLFVNYLGGILLVIVLILAVELKLIPDFFVQGVGPTLLRAQVLGAATVLFSYSSIVLMRQYMISQIPILYWFSLGLASIAIGFLSGFLGTFPGGPFSWLGRISLAVGGIYFVAAILVAYRETGAKTANSRKSGPN
ncbi:MAG: hypothetical protein HY619_05430 [Thaumarchaeota archaeon]|nr:hypothetical protein [Nitrososphaerota archaeon]